MPDAIFAFTNINYPGFLPTFMHVLLLLLNFINCYFVPAGLDMVSSIYHTAGEE